jgi:tetratricopeptide (TPR) repeat protein
MFVFADKVAGVRRRLPVQLAGLFLLLVLVSPAVYSHADLLLQIEQLTEQLEQQPDNADLLLKRGNLQRRHGDWVSARADFRRVREIQPDNKTIDWFEGRLDVESGRAAEGVQYLDRFLLANPDHAIALQNRAQGQLLLGQPLLAAQDFATVIETSDKPAPSLYSANSFALIDAGGEHFSSAMKVVQSGLARFPSEINLTGIGVDLSLAQSDTDTADELMGQLPVAIQKLPQWQTREALMDCLNGHEEKAALWFTSAGTIMPQVRQRPGLLDEQWLTRLGANPSPENCQAAALEILQCH